VCVCVCFGLFVCLFVWLFFFHFFSLFFYCHNQSDKVNLSTIRSDTDSNVYAEDTYFISLCNGLNYFSVQFAEASVSCRVYLGNDVCHEAFLAGM
jgi:hypothetical protein